MMAREFHEEALDKRVPQGIHEEMASLVSSIGER